MRLPKLNPLHGTRARESFASVASRTHRDPESRRLQYARLVSLKHRLAAIMFAPLSVRSWWATVVVAAAAAFLIAAFVSSQLKAAEILPDFRYGYHPGALNIQRGAGYVDQSGELITAWPPGMSIVASPWVGDDVKESERNLRYLSGLLAVVWVISVALLARLVVPQVSVILVLALAVFWPPMWALGDPMGSEMLFAVLSTVAVCLLVGLYRLRSRSVLVTVALASCAWLFFAAASLTRTMGIAVAGAVLIGIAAGFHDWSVRRRGAVLLLSCVVFAAGLAPWVWEYRQHTGHYGFGSNGFYSVKEGLRRYPDFPAGWALSEQGEGWQSFRDMWPDLRALSVADPLGTLRLLAMKIIDPWRATTSRRFDRYLLAIQLPWLVLFVVTSCRTLLMWRRVPGEVILLHGCVGALWMTSAFVYSLLRYLSPAFPFVVIIVLWHAVDSGVLGLRNTAVPSPSGRA